MKHKGNYVDKDFGREQSRFANMITKDEFAARRLVARQQTRKKMLIWIGIISTFVLGSIPFAMLMDHFDTPEWVAIIYITIFVGFLACNIVLLIRSFYRDARRFGLNCPNCEMAMGPAADRFTLRTGKCMRCGAVILKI